MSNLGVKLIATWSRYRETGTILCKTICDKRPFMIFSLTHLGKITGIKYEFLHRSVSQIYNFENHQIFSIKKIWGTTSHLRNQQNFFHCTKIYKWWNFTKNTFFFFFFCFSWFRRNKSGLSMQCACKWLLKFDLRDFYTVL